jgi:Ca2+/Na+ antiporter
MAIFVPSDGIGAVPQLFLMAVYGYILFTASKTISAGSEMLLTLYGPGIIGGLLIPVLGAVPDCAIILVSGLGDRDKVQEELAVGVGTLAGSTIMLLTLPWAAGVVLGARDLDVSTGQAASERDPVTGRQKPKHTGLTLTRSVVTTDDNVPVFSRIMMATLVSFLIIQIPAFTYDPHDTVRGRARARAPGRKSRVHVR